MLSDPQSVTFTSGAKSLVKINQDQYSSEYYLRESDAEYRLRVRHSKTAPNAKNPLGLERHNVEFTETIFATNEVPEFTRKVYAVYEVPSSKINAAMWATISGWLTANSYANPIAVNGWQS